MIYINNKTLKAPRAVMKCDPDTLSILKIYNSLVEASEDNGNVDKSGIAASANGKDTKGHKRITCGGYIWRWKPLVQMKH